MERAELGRLLFIGAGLTEAGVLVGGVSHSTMVNIAVLAGLVVILPFVIGYLIARFGLVYGLVLGLMPAIFALSELPTELFGLSRVAGAVVLFFGYVLLSGLSGLGGQRLALWRDAA